MLDVGTMDFDMPDGDSVPGMAVTYKWTAIVLTCQDRHSAHAFHTGQYNVPITTDPTPIPSS